MQQERKSRKVQQVNAIALSCGDSPHANDWMTTTNE